MQLTLPSHEQCRCVIGLALMGSVSAGLLSLPYWMLVGPITHYDAVHWAGAFIAVMVGRALKLW